MIRTRYKIKYIPVNRWTNRYYFLSNQHRSRRDDSYLLVYFCFDRIFSQLILIKYWFIFLFSEIEHSSIFSKEVFILGCIDKYVISCIET